MQYTIKTAAILLKNKTHAIYDDNGDIKTLRKVLKKAFPEDHKPSKKDKLCFYRVSKVFDDIWLAEPVLEYKGLQIINLSEITKKPKKMQPETFTISKADYDKFKDLEKCVNILTEMIFKQRDL